MSYHEACQQYPDIMNKLLALDSEISGGTTATVVLIYNNKLYMANVGKFTAFNPIAPRNAKIVYNFDISECNRVNQQRTIG